MKYDYEVINERLHPVIRGILVGESNREDLTMTVDTGFDGGLLIPTRLYKNLVSENMSIPPQNFLY